MLGSLAEADDAVQEAWLRLSRTEASDVENLRAWLTAVVGRVCLNILRSRRTRGETPLEAHVADPIISPEKGAPHVGSQTEPQPALASCGSESGGGRDLPAAQIWRDGQSPAYSAGANNRKIGGNVSAKPRPTSASAAMK
jgi:hypothetical protein